LKDPSRFAAIAASDAPVDSWFLHNKETADEQSWMSVEFYSGVAVESLPELRQYVSTKFPDLTWSDYTDSNMAGFRSNEYMDPNDQTHQATMGRLVYFMDRKMIVSVSWRRHPAGGGASDVTTLIQSMDRYTAGPVVQSIEMSPAGRVNAGERACYTIKVDDLKSSFVTGSLKEIVVSGLSKSWIWTDVRWDESRGAFEACLVLPRSLTSTADLLVIKLRIENERSKGVNCVLNLAMRDPKLQCFSSGSVLAGAESTYPPVQLADLENTNPDLEAPKVTNIVMDQSDGAYKLRAEISELSKITGGWILLKQIPGGDQDIFIAPWQIGPTGFEIDFTEFSTNGTRRVSEVLLTDEHGNASRLMPCDDYKKFTGPGLRKTLRSCNPANYVHCVSIKNVEETCDETNIPVVEYFSQYRARR
ncbi:MAG: hypothetical protein WCO71_04795, partial [Pseudomonadota bacterium]